MGQLIEVKRLFSFELFYSSKSPKEVSFLSFFNNLPFEDQSNVSKVGRWALRVVGSDGEVWVVGSTVKNFVKGEGTKGKDIDFRFLSNLPNQEMIERISKDLKSFPEGFSQESEERWDDYFGIKYFTYKFFPLGNSGRPIHILPPRIWEMKPEDQRRLGIFAEGPFCKIDGSILDNFFVAKYF